MLSTRRRRLAFTAYARRAMLLCGACGLRFDGGVRRGAWYLFDGQPAQRCPKCGCNALHDMLVLAIAVRGGVMPIPVVPTS